MVGHLHNCNQNIIIARHRRRTRRSGSPHYSQQPPQACRATHHDNAQLVPVPTMRPRRSRGGVVLPPLSKADATRRTRGSRLRAASPRSRSRLLRRPPQRCVVEGGVAGVALPRHRVVVSAARGTPIVLRSPRSNDPSRARRLAFDLPFFFCPSPSRYVGDATARDARSRAAPSSSTPTRTPRRRSRPRRTSRK